MSVSWLARFFYSQIFVTLPYPTKSFAGETIIVTGSNTGLGYEAAKHFVRLKASKVVLAVRNISKGEAAKASIISSLTDVKPNTIVVWPLDLSSFDSIREFVKLADGLERLDALVENAGIQTNYWKEFEGIESVLATNVIATELLGLLLLPKLRETASRFNSVPRLSIVASDLHFVVKFEERNEPDILAALNNKEKTNFGERYVLLPLSVWSNR